MSESRELDSGPSDKEGEKGKDSQGEGKEKEEGKSEANVSEEASNTEVADKKNLRTSGEENADSADSPSKKKMKQSNDPQAQSGDRSKQPSEDVQPNTDPNEPSSGSDSDSDMDSDENKYWPDEVFLFEMEAPSTNRLVIPLELASTHFPPLATRKPNEVETLQFTDSQNHEWYMPIQYYRDERGFMILTGWQEFSTQYDLKPMDLIRVYKPVPRLHAQHFIIEVEKKQGRVEIPEFREENFLFQIELERSDIGFKRVFLARDDVRNFPGVKMQGRNREKKTMRFTDAQSKNWYMNIVRYSEEKYMVIDGWHEFVKERGLEAGDLVGFYKHEHPYHRKHYLIGIVKKDGGGVNPGQPGGGSGAGRGGAGSSDSGSYMGKEIAGGD